MNQKRPGIDKEFPEKRDKNHGQDNDKGPEPPGYGTEAFHFFAGRRRQGYHGRVLTKS